MYNCSFVALRITELEAELQAKKTHFEDLVDLMMDQDAKIKEYEDQLRSLGRPIDYPADSGESQSEQHTSTSNDVCSQVQAVSLNDPAEATLVHPLVSLATSISHTFIDSTSNITPVQTLTTSQPSHSMLPLQQSSLQTSSQEPPLVIHTPVTQPTLVAPAPPPVSVVAAVLPDSPAVQAITSVVPAPIAQTATVSDLGAPQPLLMTTVSAEQATTATAPPQFVHFYNPASMFQP
ncbi:general vesicular transport factor p115-like, partial [Tropilaelaps mercedesae]